MAVQLQNIIHDVLEDVHCRAEMHLTELTTLNFPDKDVYQQLTTNIEDGETKNFTLIDGTLTCVTGGCKFFFSGSANCRVNKACRVTFELHIDDVFANGCRTPVDFTVLDKTKSFNCSQIVEISEGQTVKVKAVCDTDNIDFTLEAFSIVLWGI